MASTSSIVRTGRTVSLAVTWSGISASSGALPAGMMAVVMPARAAASSFSLSPPMGSTSPAQGELAGHGHVAAHGDARRSARPARRPW